MEVYPWEGTVLANNISGRLSTITDLEPSLNTTLLSKCSQLSIFSQKCLEACSVHMININLVLISFLHTSGTGYAVEEKKPELGAQSMKACARRAWKIASVKACGYEACFHTFIFGFESPSLQSGVFYGFYLCFLMNLILFIKCIILFTKYFF